MAIIDNVHAIGRALKVLRGEAFSGTSYRAVTYDGKSAKRETVEQEAERVLQMARFIRDDREFEQKKLARANAFTDACVKWVERQVKDAMLNEITKYDDKMRAIHTRHASPYNDCPIDITLDSPSEKTGFIGMDMGEPGGDTLALHISINGKSFEDAVAEWNSKVADSKLRFNDAYENIIGVIEQADGTLKTAGQPSCFGFETASGDALVRELIDVHHCDPQEVAIEIGATLDEVDLLRQEGVFAAKKSDQHTYSKAWYPKETRNAE